jgi:hypothetical protein
VPPGPRLNSMSPANTSKWMTSKVITIILTLINDMACTYLKILLYIYLSIIVCYNLLFSYDHSKYKVGIFTGCIYVQSIFILIDFNFSFDNG